MAFTRRNPIFKRLAATFAAVSLFGAVAAKATPSVVIDVASGQILEQDQATASWYPASLTKLMTAYVALDAVRKGKIALDTPLMVSPRATRMAPSKMGFRPGTEVTLQNALVMLMVKSANDIAVTIAEGVSGSVEAFADDMNRASIALGMHESYWVNPNGLPDSRQVTSARDLALLGRALYVEFPQHAWLYNIGAMQLGRSVHATHNGLLGRYPGADGMKTGFTCPAGFNLVASATHGGQKLIAVVLGAPTAAARTAKAAALLDRAFHGAAAQGSVASLPSNGVAAAPDMRDSVCRHRGKAHAEFMAEVEDMAIPIGSGASTGIPLLDTLGAAGQPHINVKEIAHLPRPRFEPVQIYVGRAAGYIGPVARTRAPGAAIGELPDLAAYVEEKPAPADAENSPLSRAAPDAKPLRQRGAAGKRGKREMARAVQATPAADDAAAAGAAPVPPVRDKARGQANEKPADKKRADKSGGAKPQAGKGKPAGAKSAAAPGKPQRQKLEAANQPAVTQ